MDGNDSGTLWWGRMVAHLSALPSAKRKAAPSGWSASPQVQDLLQADLLDLQREQEVRQPFPLDGSADGDAIPRCETPNECALPRLIPETDLRIFCNSKLFETSDSQFGFLDNPLSHCSASEVPEQPGGGFPLAGVVRLNRCALRCALLRIKEAQRRFEIHMESWQNG